MLSKVKFCTSSVYRIAKFVYSDQHALVVKFFTKRDKSKCICVSIPEFKKGDVSVKVVTDDLASLKVCKQTYKWLY